MDDSSGIRDRRTVTPAIVVSAVFAAACAVFAVTFVGARGGLQMPIAATGPPVAVASEPAGEPTEPPPTPLPSPAPTTPPAPTVAPTVVATPPPSVAPSPVPTFAVPTLEPGDPLLALRGCPDHPACFEYTVVRGDTLSSIISRYRLDIDVLEALNPGRLSNPSLIVTGQVLYLGRFPLGRLDPCPNGEACMVYVVQAGDSLAEIANRYLLTPEAILDANPGLPRPLVAGQEIKLPA